MTEMTLEDMAKRLTDLEIKVAALTSKSANHDWRLTVGMFEGDEFSKRVDEEAAAIRESQRRAAREEPQE